MAMKTMHICPHTIRVIEDWAGKKVSPRGHSMMDKPNKEKDVPFQQRTTITPGVGEQGENLDGDVTPIRAVTNHTRNRSDIARGTLPNKNTFFVRTLQNEVPVSMEKSDPHSPLAIVSPAIVPKDLKILRRGKKHVSHSLGYSSIYQNEKYHIIHHKGHDNFHEMKIEPNNCDIKPFKKKILKTVGF